MGSDAAGTMLVVSTAYGGSDVRIERRDPVTGALIRSTPPTSAVTAPGIGGVIGSGVRPRQRYLELSPGYRGRSVLSGRSGGLQYR